MTRARRDKVLWAIQIASCFAVLGLLRFDAPTCAARELRSFEGVVLALATGTATFATEDPSCAYVLIGSDDVLDEVFAAWKTSPYESPIGEIRPVYVAVDGDVIVREEKQVGGKRFTPVPYFQVHKINEISDQFSEGQARAAFWLRMSMPLQHRHPKSVAEDPQERVQLTD